MAYDDTDPDADGVVEADVDNTATTTEQEDVTGVSSDKVIPLTFSTAENFYSSRLNVITPATGRHFAQMAELDATAATDTEHRVASFASVLSDTAPAWALNILAESDATLAENLWAMEVDVNAEAGGVERGIDITGTLNADPVFGIRLTRGPNSTGGEWADGFISEFVRDYHLRLRDGAADADKWRVTPDGTTEIDTIENKITDFDGRFYSDLSFYIRDAFGDNNLSTRTDAAVGSFFSMDDGKIRARYRPSWTNVLNAEVTGNKLRLNGVDGSPAAAEFDTAFTTGEWKHTIQAQATPDGIFETDIIREDGNNRISIEFQSGGTLRLRKRDTGTFTTLVTGTWPADTSEHTLRVTRDKDGNWELFMNGTSQGTATDTFLPTPSVLRCTNFSASTVDYDLDRFELS